VHVSADMLLVVRFLGSRGLEAWHGQLHLIGFLEQALLGQNDVPKPKDGGHSGTHSVALPRNSAFVYELCPDGRRAAALGKLALEFWLFADLPSSNREAQPSCEVTVNTGAASVPVNRPAAVGVWGAVQVDVAQAEELISLSVLVFAFLSISSRTRLASRAVARRESPGQMRVRGALSPGQCRRLVRHIDENVTLMRICTEIDLPLSDLSALTGLRQRHFSTLFRKAFQVSPHRFLVTRRLEQGARLLAQSQSDIAEIALSVGFSSQSHFSELFRRQFGVTPREFVISRRKSSSAGSSQ
jgi:AraC-like DNA-binding protein